MARVMAEGQTHDERMRALAAATGDSRWRSEDITWVKFALMAEEQRRAKAAELQPDVRTEGCDLSDPSDTLCQ